MLWRQILIPAPSYGNPAGGAAEPLSEGKATAFSAGFYHSIRLFEDSRAGARPGVCVCSCCEHAVASGKTECKKSIAFRLKSSIAKGKIYIAKITML